MPDGASTRDTSRTWCSGSTKCSIRCEEHTSSNASLRRPEHRAVRALVSQAGLAVCRHGGCRGRGVVVDPHHEAVLAGEADALVAEPAADVEESPVAHSGAHLAVAGRVQGQERIGGLALHGAFAGELHSATSVVGRRACSGQLRSIGVP